jgi:hypothetical protein
MPVNQLVEVGTDKLQRFHLYWSYWNACIRNNFGINATASGGDPVEFLVEIYANRNNKYYAFLKYLNILNADYQFNTYDLSIPDAYDISRVIGH